MGNNSLHTSSRSFCTHQWGVQHRLSSGEYPQSNGRADLGAKSAKCIIYDNVEPNGSLNTNAAAGTVLQYRNTPLPNINLSPAQILFYRQLRDHLPVKSCYYNLHKDWIISSKQKEDYAHRQNQQTVERYDSPITRECPSSSWSRYQCYYSQHQKLSKTKVGQNRNSSRKTTF